MWVGHHAWLEVNMGVSSNEYPIVHAIIGTYVVP